MKKLALAIALLPGLALAQASVNISIDLPMVLPKLVVVSPGVQVVPDCDHEVFYTNGYYWAREDDGRWYRSRNHRGGWVYMEPRRVPPGLVRVPPGQYRRWHGRPYVAPARPAMVPNPGLRPPPPAYYEERHHHDRDEDRDDQGHGHGRGHDEHGNGHGYGHEKHGD